MARRGDLPSSSYKRSSAHDPGCAGTASGRVPEVHGSLNAASPQGRLGRQQRAGTVVDAEIALTRGGVLSTQLSRSCDTLVRQVHLTLDVSHAMPYYEIALFVSVGFIFGQLTYTRRHLFGEGPPDQYADPEGGLSGRLFWVTICTLLWPVQIVGGLHGLWRVRAAARRQLPH
jgi:hypothetical protein